MSPREIAAAIRKDERFIREILLINVTFSLKHLIKKGIARSTQAASQKVKWFIDRGLVIKNKSRFRCEPDAEKAFNDDEDLKPKNEIEGIKRTMKKVFHESQFISKVESLPELSSKIKTNPFRLNRPPWFFDVTAIIHPAMTIDKDLLITDFSTKLHELVEIKFDNFPELVKQKKINLVDFLRKLDLYHFDHEEMEITDTHVLDKYNDKEGIFAELCNYGAVNKLPAAMTVNGDEIYLDISFVLQTSFLGIQSIWPVVNERISYMRSMKAIQVTKRLLTGHKLKQPMNSFNASCAILKKLLPKFNDKDLRNHVANVIEHLNNGRDSFQFFLQEMEIGERKGQVDLIEKQDILLILKDAVYEVDTIYGKKQKVKVNFQFDEDDVGKLIIKTSYFLMKESFFNLVHNAVKYGSEENEKPEVRIYYNLDDFEIFIEDNGKGLNPYEVGKFNSHFDQIKERPSLEQLGMFSGVYLSMIVIKASAGMVTFENQKKGGLRVRMKF